MLLARMESKHTLIITYGKSLLRLGGAFLVTGRVLLSFFEKPYGTDKEPNLRSFTLGVKARRGERSEMPNNLTSLLNPFNERTTFVYDALNRAVTVTHGNQTKAEHDYNGAGWLTALRNLKSDNSAISIFTYTYDNAANRLSMAEANGDRVTWTYDAIDQLTRERRSGANSFDITYTYDPVGNRLTKLEGGTTTTYSYDSANELTTEQAGATITTYSYDSNGNTTLKNAAGALTTYTWDGENRMTKLEQPTSPAVMTFTYDGNSFRRTLHDGSNLTKFLYAWQTGTPGLDPILMETDGSDATVAVYAPTA